MVENQEKKGEPPEFMGEGKRTAVNRSQSGEPLEKFEERSVAESRSTVPAVGHFSPQRVWPS